MCEVFVVETHLYTGSIKHKAAMLETNSSVSTMTWQS